MQSEERKDIIIRLYNALSQMSKLIESDLDTLSDNGNTSEFELALSELSELASTLLNDK